MDVKPNADKQIRYQGVTMGCDPELFFERGGQIIGAEKVIPEKGLDSKRTDPREYGVDKEKAFVLDGVQVELNPNPHYCRGGMGLELRTSFRTLRAHLAGMKDIKASFRSVVEVDPKELDSLSDRAKILGCAPSKNLYDTQAKITVDPEKYLKRSAGGHIHIGLNDDTNFPALKQLMPYREEVLVPLMDCLVGLPSVFVDRDPLAAERRKVYGRAGEYRLPEHGLEYRTLSNFWLRSYQTMSMVFGLTRLAVSVAATSYVRRTPPGRVGPKAKPYENWDAAEELIGGVDLELVMKAINGSDLTLAKQAWKPVQNFITEHVKSDKAVGGDTGLNAELLGPFGYFTDKIEKHGIEYWFPQDPIEHWCAMPDQYAGNGWEAFMANKVALEAAGQKSDFTTVYGGKR